MMEWWNGGVVEWWSKGMMICRGPFSTDMALLRK
jgi:hypothetical protein